MGREVLRLLAELENDDDLYLDSIRKIVMDTWTRGRVSFEGDDGYSHGTAVGGENNLAVVGAYVLLPNGRSKRRSRTRTRGVKKMIRKDELQRQRIGYEENKRYIPR